MKDSSMELCRRELSGGDPGELRSGKSHKPAATHETTHSVTTDLIRALARGVPQGWSPGVKTLLGLRIGDFGLRIENLNTVQWRSDLTRYPKSKIRNPQTNE